MGIYSVAGKIYGIVKNLLSAVLVVSIPRLSHYAGAGDKANFNKLFNNIFNALIVVVAPAVVGLFCPQPGGRPLYFRGKLSGCG